MPNVYPDLWQRYQATKAVNTTKYARDIAAETGISEAELTVARLGYDVVRLSDDAWTLIAALERVGETKCICRNEYVVHEQVGQFTHQHPGGHAGLVLNPHVLDLHLFLSQRVSAFHLNDNGRQSTQSFGHHGDALLKVYATTQTGVAVWDTLVAERRVVVPAPPALRPLEPVKYAGTANGTVLENDWRTMIDVHQLFGLLRKYQFSRQQAFRLVSDDLVCRVDRHALSSLPETVRQKGNEIIIFVDNRGCVQIFIGALEKLAPMRGQLNIFNTTFTLHLRGESPDEVWVTRKPTLDGHVTSVELFAKDGTQVAQLYGQRSEDHPEQVQWCQRADHLTREGLPV